MRALYHWAYNQFVRLGEVVALAGTGGSSDHSTLTGVTANQHHNQQHAFGGADHTGLAISGATPAQMLIYSFGAWRNTNIPRQSWFDNKPHGEPIFIVETGDSNTNAGPLGGMVQNPRVFEYGTNGAGGPLAWRVADPNGPIKGDYDSLSAAGYTGMYQGGVGSMTWSCADYLQKLTGRDVYLICVWRNNIGIDQWLPGGDIYSRWQTDVAAAQATTQIGGRPADCFIWQQSAYDTYVTPPADKTPAEYAAAWAQVYDNAPANQDRYSQWCLPMTTTGFQPNTTDSLSAAIKPYHEFLRLVDSGNLADIGDDTHWAGESARAIGQMCAYKFARGPV